MTWDGLSRGRSMWRNSARRGRRIAGRLEILEPREMLTYVEMDTTYGTIHLSTTSSPAANDFASYFNFGVYDGTIFHRLVPGATLSGGAFKIDGTPITRNTGAATTFTSPNTRGSISAIPIEGTSKFSGAWFINLADNPQLDAAGYMVIGYIESEDMHIVDTIAALPTFDIRGHESVPLRDYVLEDPPRLPGPENFIVVDDARLTPIQVSLQDGQVAEGDDGVTYGFVTAAVSVAANSTIVLNYDTQDGTAHEGEDYVHSTNSLILNPGETFKTIRLQIHPDHRFEANETVRVRVTQSSGAMVVDDEAILTIINDDRGVPGDTNFDNRVDLEDLNNVRNHFGEVGEDVLGDVTDDGVVDLVDLNTTRNYFGESVEPPEITFATMASRANAHLAAHRVLDAFDAVFCTWEQNLSRVETRLRRRYHLQPARGNAGRFASNE